MKSPEGLTARGVKPSIAPSAVDGLKKRSCPAKTGRPSSKYIPAVSNLFYPAIPAGWGDFCEILADRQSDSRMIVF